MGLFSGLKKKKPAKDEKRDRKSKPKKSKKRGGGLFGKKSHDYIAQLRLQPVSEDALFDTLNEDLDDKEQPYVSTDDTNHLIYLIALNNKLIDGSSIADHLGDIKTAADYSNRKGDIAGSLYNASTSNDLKPHNKADKKIVFVPTVNTLKTLSEIAEPSQEFLIVSLPSDISADNLDDYYDEGRVNAPIMGDDQKVITATLDDFKDFVKINTEPDADEAYDDHDTADPSDPLKSADADDESTDDENEPSTGDEGYGDLDGEAADDAGTSGEALDEKDLVDTPDLPPDPNEDPVSSTDDTDNGEGLPDIPDAPSDTSGSGDIPDMPNDIPDMSSVPNMSASSDDSSNDDNDLSTVPDLTSGSDDMSESNAQSTESDDQQNNQNDDQSSSEDDEDDLSSLNDLPDLSSDPSDQSNNSDLSDNQSNTNDDSKGQFKDDLGDLGDLNDLEDLSADSSDNSNDSDDNLTDLSANNDQNDNQSDNSEDLDALDLSNPDDAGLENLDNTNDSDSIDGLDDDLDIDNNANNDSADDSNSNDDNSTEDDEMNHLFDDENADDSDDNAEADNDLFGDSSDNQSSDNDSVEDDDEIFGQQDDGEASPTNNADNKETTNDIDQLDHDTVDLSDNPNKEVEDKESQGFKFDAEGNDTTAKSNGEAPKPVENEDTVTIDMNKPSQGLNQIAPKNEETAELSDANAQALNDLKAKYGKRIDEILKGIKIPVLHPDASLTSDTEYVAQLAAANDSLKNDVIRTKEIIKTSLLAQIDNILRDVTDPTRFAQLYPRIDDVLRRKFVNEEAIKQEAARRISEINERYEQERINMIEEAKQKAEKEYQEQRIPERNHEIDKAETTVRQQHQDQYNTAVDDVLKQQRNLQQPLIDKEISNLLATKGTEQVNDAVNRIYNKTVGYYDHLTNVASMHAYVDRRLRERGQNTPNNDPEKLQSQIDSLKVESERREKAQNDRVADLLKQLDESRNKEKQATQQAAAKQKQLDDLQTQAIKYRQDAMSARADSQHYRDESELMRQQHAKLLDELNNIKSGNNNNPSPAAQPTANVASISEQGTQIHRFANKPNVDYSSQPVPAPELESTNSNAASHIDYHEDTENEAAPEKQAESNVNNPYYTPGV